MLSSSMQCTTSPCSDGDRQTNTTGDISAGAPAAVALLVVVTVLLPLRLSSLLEARLRVT